MQEDMKMLFAVFAVLINTVLGQQQSLKPCPQQTHMCFFLDPCILATCPKYPLASCRNYKCGSTCVAEFWYNGQEVTSQCASNPGKDLLTSIFSSASKPVGGTGNTVNDPSAGGSTQTSTANNACPNGQDRVNCFRQPCSVSSCPGVPGATCRDNYCGGCKAEYFLGQQDVTSQCPQQGGSVGVTIPQANTAAGPAQDPSTGNCPPNQVMRCNFSPCRVSSCVNYPNAACTDVNCGGCYAKFFYNGQEVTSVCRQQQQPARGRFPPWYYFLFGDVF